jgi:tRNA (guanine37-N1)-methyltransferase
VRFDVITLFPEMIAPFVELSIVGRAQKRGLVAVQTHRIFDALGPKERPDDRPYGGGPGMVLRLEPIARVLDAILEAAPPGERRSVVVTAAAGRPFTQADAARLAGLDRVVLVCGHYEGIDDRLAALYGAEELSLGDFVLTGGEIPALAFLDATVRAIPGVIKAESLENESFTGDGLDHPAYTRPLVFRGLAVPDVLLSGDHARVDAWRKEQARLRSGRRDGDPS